MSAGISGRNAAKVGVLALGLTGIAPLTAQALPSSGGYQVGHPEFALVTPGGRPAPPVVAMAHKSHLPNPAFAGYLTARSGVTTVVARLKAPGVACNQAESAIGPGAFLLTGPSDRESFSAANVIVGCFHGQSTAQESLVVDDVEADFSRPIEPGDAVMVKLTDDPGGKTVVEFTNLTPGRRYTLKKSGRGLTPDAQLVGDWGSADAKTQAQLPPPAFQSTTFRSVSIDRRSLGSRSPVGYDMKTPAGVLQIATSPLRGSGHDMFTTTRK